MTTESDEDEGYQQQFIRSLFATSNKDDDEVLELDNNDTHNGISEHKWITGDRQKHGLPYIIYHLAFHAPGHGDSLWNASDCIARHLLLPELRRALFSSVKRGRWPPARSIEFGAGAALPSLVLLGEGTHVTLTDRYVNRQTFDALRMSVEKNAALWGLGAEEAAARAAIVPHTWGEDVERLTSGGERADVLIASDCIYNPSYHAALLHSAARAMANGGIFIVGYSFHGNVPPSQTLDFFTLARDQFGFEVVSEFADNYDGQRGIGDMDEKRGVVYVKVLSKKEAL